MRVPQPLPTPLLNTPITASALEQHGLSRFRAYAGDLRQLRRGIRCVPGAEPTPAQVAAVVAAQAGHAVICGVTAAQLHGMRLPGTLSRSTLLHLARTDGRPRLRRPGVVGTEAAYRPGDVMMVGEVMVTTPARTFLDLARMLNPVALVAVGDGLVCTHRHGIRAGVPPLCTVEQLRRMLDEHPGVRGVRRARLALGRVRVGVDSPQETRMRLLLEDHRVGEWITDHRLIGADGREVLPDLWDEYSRTSVQYEGMHHSDPRQVHRDVALERATRSVDAVEVRVVAADLDALAPYRGQLVPRVVALVAAAVHRAR